MFFSCFHFVAGYQIRIKRLLRVHFWIVFFLTFSNMEVLVLMGQKGAKRSVKYHYKNVVLKEISRLSHLFFFIHAMLFNQVRCLFFIITVLVSYILFLFFFWKILSHSFFHSLFMFPSLWRFLSKYILFYLYFCGCI